MWPNNGPPNQGYPPQWAPQNDGSQPPQLPGQGGGGVGFVGFPQAPQNPGYPPQNYAPPPQQGYPPQNYGAPPQNYPLAPSSQGFPPMAQPPQNYPHQQGYPSGPPGGYSAPPQNYPPAPQQGYPSGPPGGYPAPPQQGFNSQPQGYNQPPYGGPPSTQSHPSAPHNPGYQQHTAGYGVAPQYNTTAPGMYSATPQTVPQSNFKPYPKAQDVSGSKPSKLMASTPAQGSTSWSGISNLQGPGPTIFPAQNFNAVNDAQGLYKAMKGIGTDEKTLNAILGQRSGAQRHEIALAFAQQYPGEDLIKWLKSETSGNYESLLVSLLDPLSTLDAKECNRAIKGLGTVDSVLIEILATRSNAQIHAICQIYQQLYGRTLQQDIGGDTSGDYRTALLNMCEATRDENPNVDMGRVQSDVGMLFAAGERKIGTDEATFINILTKASFPHIRAVDSEYQKRHATTMTKVIDSEFSGNLKETLLAIIRFAKDPALYFAEEIIRSGKGLGTNDYDLQRLIISRAEIDLNWVKQRIPAIYGGKRLGQFISSETSGDYKKLLLVLSAEHK